MNLTRVPEPSAKIARLRFVIFVTMTLTLAISGCAAQQSRPPAPGPEEIVALAKSGAPAADIIRRMQESGAVYPMSASELAKLRERGVPDEVIDYMYRTYIEAVRRDEAMRQSLYWGPPYWPGWGWRPGW